MGKERIPKNHRKGWKLLVEELVAAKKLALISACSGGTVMVGQGSTDYKGLICKKGMK